MSILVLADLHEGQLASATAHVVAAAQAIGGDIDVLVSNGSLLNLTSFDLTASGHFANDFDDETPPHESTRRILYPPGVVVEDEQGSAGVSEGDKTTMRAVSVDPSSSPKPPRPPTVPKDVAPPPPPPSSPIPQKVVPPPTTPLSQATTDAIVEVPTARRGTRRLVLVLTIVLFVIAAGAVTGVLLLSRLPVEGRSGSEAPSTAAVSPGGASSAAPVGTTVTPTPPIAPTESGAGFVAPESDAGNEAPAAIVDAFAGVPTDSEASSSSETGEDSELSVPMSTVSLRSVPRGAKVYTREGLICEETPCEYELPTGKAIRLRFERSDGLSRTKTIIPGEETSVRVRLMRRPRPPSSPPPTPPTKMDDQIW